MERRRPHESAMKTPYVFLSLVHMLSGIKFSHDRTGLSQAYKMVRQRNERLLYPDNDINLIKNIRTRGKIEKLEEEAGEAISKGVYIQSLKLSNWMYAYGNTDLTYRLGGKALQASYRYHKYLGMHVARNFLHKDPYLKKYFFRFYDDVVQARKQNDFLKELALWRAMIHVVALNGSLGEPARQYVDLLALVSPR